MVKLNKVKQPIQLLEAKENLGFSGGNNVGIKYALENGADYVMLLNNDTLVDPNLVEGMLKTYKENTTDLAVAERHVSV